jgi:hypothetical protein
METISLDQLERNLRMIYQFRNIVKELGLRGWRWERHKDEIYLSKFDERYNDDEFRFYLNIKNKLIGISRMEKIKQYQKTTKVSPRHPFIEQAERLCVFYNEKQKAQL